MSANTPVHASVPAQPMNERMLPPASASASATGSAVASLHERVHARPNASLRAFRARFAVAP